MGHIIQSPEAQDDLIEIWLYIAQDNQAAANQLLDTIDEKLKLLSDSPQMGQTSDELAPSLRSFPVGKYLVIYCPIPGGIELARVIHGAQGILKAFFELISNPFVSELFFLPLPLRPLLSRVNSQLLLL